VEARIDLHTHSNCSDGVLAPAALVTLAAQRQVALLALTDHDTWRGATRRATPARRTASASCRGRSLTLPVARPGDSRHRLNLDVAQQLFIAHCSTVLELRRQRITAMSERLTRAGLPGAALSSAALAAASPTRAHLARALCALGLASSVQAHSTAGSSAASLDTWHRNGRNSRPRCNALSTPAGWRYWPIRIATRYPMACCVSCSASSRQPGAPGSRSVSRYWAVGCRSACRAGTSLRPGRLHRLGFPRARAAMASAGFASLSYRTG